MRLNLTAIVVWAAIATVAVADDAKRPVCALVDASGHPATAILEARLLEDTQATWVERTQIKSVLREQTLSAAFGAAHVRERVSLGRLLKADVLILVRTVPAAAGKPAFIECSVCETERGIRLATASLPDDKDAQAVTDTLNAVIERGLAKQREKITKLVAVPPFLSDDLGYEHNHLQFAYARLAEQYLLHHPGWLAVEVQEAQAIAKELALTAGDDVAKRQLPLFLLGRYRHDGRAEQQTLNMSLRLMRGEQQLALKATKTLVPGEANIWIREQTQACIAAVSHQSLAEAPAAKDEARQLADRAALFESIGNWEEAAALLEASLLIQSQSETHRRAVIVYGQLARKHFQYEPKSIEAAEPCWSYYQRGLEHLEAFFQDAGPLEKYQQAGQTDFIAQFDHSPSGLSLHPKTPPEVMQRVDALRETRAAVYLRIARLRREQGFHSVNDQFFVIRALFGLPENRQMAVLLELAQEFRDLRDGQDRIVRIALQGATTPKDTPAFRDFLGELTKLDTAATRGARAVLEQKLAAAKKPQFNPFEVKPFVSDLKLQPVSFTSDTGEKKIELLGGIQASDGLDVFWSGRHLYFMHKPGELRRAFVFTNPNTHVTSLAYDGRYVWLAATRVWHSPLIVAIDPSSGKHWQFTSEEGLPFLAEGELDKAVNNFARLAPISPGKVCLAGVTGRAWLATLSLTPAGNKSARLFHEARQAANPEDAKQAAVTDIVFHPNYMLTVYEGKQYDSDCRILLGRGTGNIHATSRPLVIDPQGETVAAAAYSIWGQADPQTLIAQRDAVYVLQPEPKGVRNVGRVAYPCDKLQVVARNVPEGWLCQTGDDLYVVGKQWAHVRLSTGVVSTLAKQTSWYPIYHRAQGEECHLVSVVPSDHLGTLVFLRSKANGTQHFQFVK